MPQSKINNNLQIECIKFSGSGWQ